MDKRKLKKILFGQFSVRRVICSVISVYVCLLAFVYLFADRMIFLGRDSGYREGEAGFSFVVADARDRWYDVDESEVLEILKRFGQEGAD